MLTFVLLIPLQLATARFLVSQPVLKVMYGNIGQLDDLLLPPNISRRADGDADITYGNHDALPEFQEYLDQVEDMRQWNLKINSTSHELDGKELIEALNILTELKDNLEAIVKQHETRRQELKLPNEVDQIWRDPVALREWYYQKLCLTYLLHIRFQVDIANRHKLASHVYYGYKIGYLFHRMMKIKSQMYRIMEEWNAMKTERLSQNRPNWRTKTHNLKMLLQLYERILELDVDMKDTVELIKQAHFKRPQFQTEILKRTTKHGFK